MAFNTSNSSPSRVFSSTFLTATTPSCAQLHARHSVTVTASHFSSSPVPKILQSFRDPRCIDPVTLSAPHTSDILSFLFTQPTFHGWPLSPLPCTLLPCPFLASPQSLGLVPPLRWRSLTCWLQTPCEPLVLLGDDRTVPWASYCPDLRDECVAKDQFSLPASL